MKNITITLDEATAAWLRSRAASENVSVSRLVGGLLQSQIQSHKDYDEAMRRFLSKKPVRLRADGQPYPTRDETHDRAGLRR
jgi:hypothetical protein